MMRKKNSIKALAIILAIVCMMAMITAVPAQAKTIKVLTSVGSKTYGKDGNGKWVLTSESKSNYNKKGQYTGYEYKYYDNGKVTTSYKGVSKMDKKGRTKAYTHYYNGKLESKSKYAYKGSKTTIKSYDGKNTYTGKTVITSSKSKSTSKYYDANNNVTGKSVSTYKNGRTTKSVYTSYDEKGKVVSKSTTTYSYSGKYTISKEKSSYGYRYEQKYKFDKAGNVMYSWVKDYDSDNKLLSNSSYKYVMYKSGAYKGCVKESYRIINGEKVSKTTYTMKKIKRTVN